MAEPLQAKGVHLVVVGPSPMFEFADISKCISSLFDASTCDTNRQALADSVNQVQDLLQRQLRGSDNVSIFSPFEILCPPRQFSCSPIRNSTLLFRDRDHLNSVGSASLAPDLIRFLSLPNATSPDDYLRAGRPLANAR